MTTTPHYTGFWPKDAITAIACIWSVSMGLSACNDSTSTASTPPAPQASGTVQSPPPTESFSLSSLLDSIEGAKSDMKEAVAPHADAVQARTKEEVEKLFRWEYKVTEVKQSKDPSHLQGELTELGNNGWECFHLDRIDEHSTRLTCKRRPKSAISYLKYLPGL